MKKRLFPLLIALSALSVSASAAFYSVFGLSKLFAGASHQVMIMAGSLEFAKLVVASLLYQYWGTINKILRVYLSLAVLVLVLITSGGIYGFLSGAYQETATKSELLDKGLKVLELKQNRFEEQKSDLIIEKDQLNKSIADLRISLANPIQVSWYDKNAEEVITTTSSSARKALQVELNKTITDRNNVNIKVEETQDSLFRLDGEVLNLEISNEDQRELGPLKYLSEITGYPMNKVVNWFLLLIIFVFDPLAIAMVIAANFAFSKLKIKEIETPPPYYSTFPPSTIEINKTQTLSEEKIREISTLVGREEIKNQPIKPKPEDLKKLEKVLGLSKVNVKNKDIKIHKEESEETSDVNINSDKDNGKPLNEEKSSHKKVLRYRKRVGDDDKT